LGAAAFQWVNPKSWVIVLGAVTAYVPLDGYFLNLLLVAAVFGLVAAPSVGVWAAFGSALRRFLGSPGRVRAFNVAMAMLLVLSLYPILAEGLAEGRAVRTTGDVAEARAVDSDAEGVAERGEKVGAFSKRKAEYHPRGRGRDGRHLLRPRKNLATPALSRDRQKGAADHLC
jgi:hypothetical protein